MDKLLLDIPFPPQPSTSPPIIAAAVGVVVVSAVLLLWGHRLGRLLGALVGAALGVLLGPTAALWVGADPLVVQIIFAVLLAVAGALAYQLFWALVGALALSSVAALWTLSHYIAKVPADAQPKFKALVADSVLGWLAGIPLYLLEVAKAVWENEAFAAALIVGVALGLALVAALLRVRFTTVVVTAILGALGLLAGGSTLALAARPDLWQILWDAWLYYLLAGVVLVVLGTALQYRGILRRLRRKQAAGAHKDRGDSLDRSLGKAKP